MAPSNHTFGLSIRWRARRNLSWEVETLHPGFATPTAAALAAHGIGPQGVMALRLEEGELLAERKSGDRRPMEIGAVWERLEAHAVPEESCFHRVDLNTEGLTQRGLDGLFDARAFRVVNEQTGEDLALRVLWDGSELRVEPARSSTQGTEDNAS